SMDILISSNLERLIYDLSDCDDKAVVEWQEKLSKTGKYEVSEKVFSRIKEEFFAAYCDDKQTKATIKRVFDKFSYLCDTHTAVAVSAYEEYKLKTGDNKKVIIASTANPYKFSQSVLSAITGEVSTADEYEQSEKLEQISKLPMPSQLSGLKTKPVRFPKSIDVQDMSAEVIAALKL
ncbi:MAG: threonine synthase, partial [Oscillospiraceae bacterium]